MIALTCKIKSCKANASVCFYLKYFFSLQKFKFKTLNLMCFIGSLNYIKKTDLKLSKYRISTQYLRRKSRNLLANYKGTKCHYYYFASDGCNLLGSPGAIWDCALLEIRPTSSWIVFFASGFFLFYYVPCFLCES